MVTLKLITALASAIKLFLIHQAYYKVEVAVPIRLLAVSAFLAALYLPIYPTVVYNVPPSQCIH